MPMKLVTNKLPSTPFQGQFVVVWQRSGKVWAETLYVDPINSKLKIYNPVNDSFDDEADDECSAYVYDKQHNLEEMKDVTFFTLEEES